MLVEYYAHSCFALSTPRVRVILDPYGPEVGYPLPLRTAHYTLISHNHFDHNHLPAVLGRTTVLRGGAPREFEGLKVRGFLADHDREEGRRYGQVTCFVLELDGLRVAHLSDLGRPLTSGELAELGKVDLLMVPVGGGDYTLDGAEAAQVVAAVKPSWVLPMHYRTPFLNRQLFPDLSPLDKFLAYAGKVHKPGSPSVELAAPGPSTPEVLALPHMF